MPSWFIIASMWCEEKIRISKSTLSAQRRAKPPLDPILDIAKPAINSNFFFNLQKKPSISKRVSDQKKWILGHFSLAKQWSSSTVLLRTSRIPSPWQLRLKIFMLERGWKITPNKCLRNIQTIWTDSPSFFFSFFLRIEEFKEDEADEGRLPACWSLGKFLTEVWKLEL